MATIRLGTASLLAAPHVRDMLPGIDPLLSGEPLRILDEMGHGDTLLLADRNYPAASSGRPVVRLGEVTTVRAARTILSVMPLDSVTAYPLERMEVNDDPGQTTPTRDALLERAHHAHSPSLGYSAVPRLSFYDRPRSAYVAVRRLDATPYACFLLHRGVVFDR